MDPILRRELMLDNYNNPTNKYKGPDNYIKINTNSESCIDNVDIYYKIENDIIKDICFDGEACAISTSATSIMIKELIGKTIDEAETILENYKNMINEKEYDEDVLNELNAYSEIYLQPNRKTCALLPFKSLEKVLSEVKGE